MQKHSLIIAGSRDYPRAKVLSILNEKKDHILDNIYEVVCGMCHGPDLVGKEWAEENGIPVKKFPAEWNKYGKQAGFIRNKAMAEHATMLYAFWDGKSNGTKDMIKQARRINLHVEVFLLEESHVRV